MFIIPYGVSKLQLKQLLSVTRDEYREQLSHYLQADDELEVMMSSYIEELEAYSEYLEGLIEIAV